MSRFSRISYPIVFLFVVTGCAQNGSVSKAEGGTAIGAVTGAAIGATVSKDKTKGALLGALLGGLLGNRIGNLLDERDRARLQESTQKSIVTGTNQSWVNPNTGVQAKTLVKEAPPLPPQQRQIVVLKDKVKQVPPLEFIGEDYAAQSEVNVRGGPAADYEIVDHLKRGEEVRVVGKVTGKSWYMVSQNGAGSGFVLADLLKPLGKSSVNIPSDSDKSLPAATNVTETPVAASTTCRVVTQLIKTKDGQTANESVKACRGPNGWEIVAA